MSKRKRQKTEVPLTPQEDKGPKGPKGQFKNWAVTLFELDFEWEELDKEQFQYVLACQEEGEEKKHRHWQAYVQFKKKTRFTAVKKVFPKAHIEVCKGTPDENIKYCKKDLEKKRDWFDKETMMYEYGTPTKQGGRSDLTEIKKLIDDGGSMLSVAESHFGSFVRYNRGFEKYSFLKKMDEAKKFRQVEVIVYWGETGTGKTRKAFAEPDNFLMHASELGKNWWDGYNYEKTLIIDEYDSQVSVTTMLKLLDGYPVRLQTKGGHTWAGWTKVIITNNVDPLEWHTNAKQAHRDALSRRITKTVHFEKCAEVRGNTDPHFGTVTTGWEDHPCETGK